MGYGGYEYSGKLNEVLEGGSSTVSQRTLKNHSREEREMSLTYTLVLTLLAVGYGFSSAAWLLISTASLDEAIRA